MTSTMEILQALRACGLPPKKQIGSELLKGLKARAIAGAKTMEEVRKKPPGRDTLQSETVKRLV